MRQVQRKRGQIETGLTNVDLILKAARNLWKVLERPIGSSMEGAVKLEERVQLRNCFAPRGQEWGSRGRVLDAVWPPD